MAGLNVTATSAAELHSEVSTLVGQQDDLDWTDLFGRNVDPAFSIGLTIVTLLLITFQILLVFRIARNGGLTLEDSEAAVRIYLAVDLHNDPYVYLLESQGGEARPINPSSTSKTDH